jgi:peptide methionine sulfoxide reductase msrA/msrB
MGICDLLGSENPLWAARKDAPLGIVKNTTIANQKGNMGKKGASVKTEIATFAGGCFWCTEADFEKLPGVVRVISGYKGGQKENPTYQEVSAGKTGHVEAVRVYYDPSKVTYAELLDFFWRHIDPTDPGGQFVDRGSQYRSVIFYHDEAQKNLAEKSKEDLGKSGKFDKPIVTEVIKFAKFYEAEEYHQDYYKKNPLRYKYYRHGSGRDQFLDEIWGKVTKSSKAGNERTYKKPDDATLKKILTPPSPPGYSQTPAPQSQSADDKSPAPSPDPPYPPSPAINFSELPPREFVNSSSAPSSPDTGPEFHMAHQ